LRRSLVAVVFTLAPLAALLYGAAASLGVNGGVLQAGQDSGLKCDATGVTVSYQVQFLASPTPAAFKVQTVTISGIDHQCNNAKLSLQLTDSNGQGLLTNPVTITVRSSGKNPPCTGGPGGGGPPQPFTCSTSMLQPIDAANIWGVHISILKK
jgi:hypothetical protein